MLFGKRKSGYASVLLALTLLLTGCNVNTQPSEPPVSTPIIQEGVVTDTVTGRFAQNNGIIYCAVSDCIIRYDGQSVTLQQLADKPDYLCYDSGTLVYREVLERDEYFTPTLYGITSMVTADLNATSVKQGNISYVTSINGDIYYADDEGMHCISLGMGTEVLIAQGEITSPYRVENKLYLGYNGSLCVLEPSGEMQVLVAGCSPMNITADEQNVYYCTEINSALITYNLESGISTASNINNLGLTLYDGVHYYIKNADICAMYRADTDEEVLQLGIQHTCSVPCFTNDGVYFFVSGDYYYGLVLVNPDTGDIFQLADSEG